MNSLTPRSSNAFKAVVSVRSTETILSNAVFAGVLGAMPQK
jgi:hypothetical protein